MLSSPGSRPTTTTARVPPGAQATATSGVSSGSTPRRRRRLDLGRTRAVNDMQHNERRSSEQVQPDGAAPPVGAQPDPHDGRSPRARPSRARPATPATPRASCSCSRSPTWSARTRSTSGAATRDAPLRRAGARAGGVRPGLDGPADRLAANGRATCVRRRWSRRPSSSPLGWPPASSAATGRWSSSVLQRADEPGELLAYWLAAHGRAVPKPVKRGVADAAVRLYTRAVAAEVGLGRAVGPIRRRARADAPGSRRRAGRASCSGTRSTVGTAGPTRCRPRCRRSRRGRS